MIIPRLIYRRFPLIHPRLAARICGSGNHIAVVNSSARASLSLIYIRRILPPMYLRRSIMTRICPGINDCFLPF